MEYGLSEKHISMIKRYFELDQNVKEVILFGSRATNSYRNGSDIDFVVKIEDHSKILNIKMGLNELPTLYSFDVVDYEHITSKNFKDEIDKTGIIFYKRPSTLQRIFLILIDTFKKNLILLKKLIKRLN